MIGFITTCLEVELDCRCGYTN